MTSKQDALTVKLGIIVHAVSVNGKLDGGFTKKLVTIYPQVVEPYMLFCSKADENPIDRLGQILLVPVAEHLTIANLFCIRDSTVEQQFDHVAFIICLDKLMEADKSSSLIHFSYKMGCRSLDSGWKNIARYIHRTAGRRARICIFNSKPIEP